MQRKFDPRAFQLGYVTLATEPTKHHDLEANGMTQTASGDDGSVFHNVVLTPADNCSTSAFS